MFISQAGNWREITVADLGEGPRGPRAPRILGQKKKQEKITEGRKAGRASKTKTASPNVY